MVEMVLHEFSKATDNKLRWDANVDEVLFELYIPKWRVPEPWPPKILVSLEAYREGTATKCFSGDRSQSIEAIVQWYSDHTKTTRYQPVGEKDSWEIGEPYIPHDLLPDAPKKVWIKVDWAYGRN